MTRILGLDLARALAIYGMFASHVGDTGLRGSDAEGWRWLAFVEGRASALFAVLMGVTVVLMARKSTAAHTRWRLVVRAGMLIALGYALEFLQTPVDVILVNLGVMMLMAAVALRWPTAVLAAESAVLAGAGWWMTMGLADASSWARVDGFVVVEKLWSYHYPAVAWMAYVLAGMALGHLDLRARRTQVWLTATGVALASAATASGLALGGASPGPGTAGERDWASLAAHSYTPFEVASNIGVVLAALGLSLWLAPLARRVLWPVLAAGAMALTAYVLHIIVIRVWGDDVVWDPSNWIWIALCVGITAFAAVWRRYLGAGPLERWITAWSTAVANKRAPLAVRPADN